MAIPAIGAGGMLGIGEESTWGTAVARSNWKDMVSMGLRRMLSKRPVPELGRFGQASNNHRYDFIESDFAGGPLSFCMSYNDSSLMLLKHIMGAVASSGAGPYDHAFTLASPPPTGLTLEQISGRAAAFNIAEVFEGCKLNGARISVSNGGLMMVETEAICQTSGGLVAPGTPSPTSGGERVRHNHINSILSWGGTPVPANSVTFTIVRNLERNQELGSLFTSEPYESDGLAVTFEIRRKWQDATLDTALLADTQAALAMDIAGSGNNALAISAPGAKIYDVQRQVSSKGVIEQVITGQCLATASSEGFSITVTNDNSDPDSN